MAGFSLLLHRCRVFFFMRKGYVYLVRQGDTDLYKIGHTSNHPKARLGELQTGNPTQLHLINYYSTCNYKEVEQLMHISKTANHHWREWFWFDLSIEDAFLTECKEKEVSANFLVERKKAQSDWEKTLSRKI